MTTKSLMDFDRNDIADLIDLGLAYAKMNQPKMDDLHSEIEEKATQVIVPGEVEYYTFTEDKIVYAHKNLRSLAFLYAGVMLSKVRV